MHWDQPTRIVIWGSWLFAQFAALITISFYKISDISCPQLHLRHLLLLPTDGFRMLMLSLRTSVPKVFVGPRQYYRCWVLPCDNATDAYTEITDFNGLNNILLQTCVHPEPPNVILFWNRVFEDAIKDWDKIIVGLGWAPNPMKVFFIRDREGLTETHREGYEKKETEIRVMRPQTTKH